MTLHDHTRRFVSLLIFFFLGPILTFGLVAGIVLRKMPGNARNWERTLSVQSGLDWRVETVEYRTPTAVRLKNVRLVNGIVSKPIFSVPELDMKFIVSDKLDTYFPGITPSKCQENDSSFDSLKETVGNLVPAIHPSSGFWQIRIPSAEIRLEHLSQRESASMVQDLFVKLLSRLSTVSECPIQILVEELEVASSYSSTRSDGKPNRVRFIAGNIYAMENEYRSDWTFQLPEVSETETERFSIVSGRLSTEIELELKTGKEPIPCEWGAVFCSAFQTFGPGSTFSGTLTARHQLEKGNFWTYRLFQTTLANLDIARFAADYTPFAVTGTVEKLCIENATFGPGNFTANGWFRVVSGAVERTLFHRLVEQFALTVKPENILEAPWGAIPFDQCAICFDLRQDGALFQSPNHNAPNLPNLFMVRYGDGVRQHPMSVLIPRVTQPVSYHSILSVLAPDNAPIVPLTPGSQKIMSMIPVENFMKPTAISKEIIAATPDSSDPFLRNKGKKAPPAPMPQPVRAQPRPVFASPWDQ